MSYVRLSLSLSILAVVEAFISLGHDCIERKMILCLCEELPDNM